MKKFMVSSFIGSLLVLSAFSASASASGVDHGKAGPGPQDQAGVIQRLNQDFCKFPDIQ